MLFIFPACLLSGYAILSYSMLIVNIILLDYIVWNIIAHVKKPCMFLPRCVYLFRSLVCEAHDLECPLAPRAVTLLDNGCFFITLHILY